MATPRTDTSVTAGPPLDTVADLLGGPRVDDLLRRAARRAPDRPALCTAAGTLRYAELDERVTRLAAALRGRLDAPRTVVAIASALTVDFATSYLAVSRSGHTSVMLNPYLREEGMAHVLATSGATAAIVTPEVYQRLSTIRGRLPELRHVVLTDRPADLGADTAELPTLAELIGDAPAGPVSGVAVGADDVASIQFTSGTTGAPKAVQLTHRNLTVNAAQTAAAHRLDDASVIFNYLPTFHMMHLNIGLAAGATAVLWTGDDIADSVGAAATHGATHFYSLPVRLARLATDERLGGLRIASLRAILSGGSALPAPLATVLREHFDVPVMQGYGLAETSPSTHFDDRDHPKSGSCGPPVAGTECRIVDLEQRAPLAIGERGEIQVRGPQLMHGYLGRELSEDLDPDGWLSTGDVGYVDADGYLFVVDRIKDVFKCDNWLVSPTQIERVMLRHPGVADCVVVDYPDEFSGAVAYALVVPAGPDVKPTDVSDAVNAQLPYYEHLRHVELVDRIPRSPNGKVRRRELRDQLRAATG